MTLIQVIQHLEAIAEMASMNDCTSFEQDDALEEAIRLLKNFRLTETARRQKIESARNSANERT